MAFLGMDIGSISVKLAIVSTDGLLLAQEYRRHHGRPQQTALHMLEQALALHPEVDNIGFTGSGGKTLADLLDAPFENEVVAQARAASHLTPQVRAIIEIGGEDSRLILLEDGTPGETVAIRDFAMNSLCAAGCGSFLDQQATRLGVNIEEEFGALALASLRPARVAGRCSVFAKTDMIHLQQKATPVSDIVAGLCYAFARNFISVLARGKDILAPVAFHGGVALNAGMERAFRELLELSPDEFLTPAHAATAGAVGAALHARQIGARLTPVCLTPLHEALLAPRNAQNAQQPLPNPGSPPGSHLYSPPTAVPINAFLGVDVGSISTNVVLMDEEKRVLAKQYLMTAGRPIEAVRQGLEAVGAEWAERVTIRGVCTTGSGRYLIGDFIGADLVKNEITAQARAAAEIDPRVDTIFEIGGQDSKYISLQDGAIVDFEMNKVCAAGTGSFLEEQAERLGVSIKGEFAQLALSASQPVRLGDRCTVFIESDLVGHQSAGASTAELSAGLAYSIVHNYLNRVVQGRRIGEHIFFQGGTAFNRAVVAAFQQVTGKPITVPEHHEVTGAIGCALMAREAARDGVASTFKGWDVSRREYSLDAFECKACANHCEINRVLVTGETPLCYGGRCEKYENRRSGGENLPDLFAQRQALLTSDYTPGERRGDGVLIGIPNTLHFSEYLPFWLAFFRTLDVPLLLSGATTKTLIEQGAEATLAEFCFPVKVAHGHAQQLIEQGATHLFLPNIQQLPRLHAGYRESVSCPYVQSLPYTLRAALTPELFGVEILAPVIDLSGYSAREAKSLTLQLNGLGVSRQQVEQALRAGYAAQADYAQALATIGAQVLAQLAPDDKAVVIVSRPYNGCDTGLNLELPRHFRELGVLPIPMDMLPVDSVDLSAEFPDLTWRYGQKILAAAEIIRRDSRLAAVYLTNFSCGPDSFLLQFFQARMGGKVFLQIEVDEHSSDVGALTRCEAFIDSLRKMSTHTGVDSQFRTVEYHTDIRRTIYIPGMCDPAHAVAAALRSEGVPSQVLPASDAESLALAKQYITGKECFPCLTTTGDMIRLLRQPHINPAETAFFMPTAGGGCRFGYYNRLQRQVLDGLGYEDVPIFSPNQNDGLYTSLGLRGGDKFVRRAWQGIIAIELLQKALHWVRPRALEPEAAEVLYDRNLNALIAAIETGTDLLPLMRIARQQFAALSTRDVALPWIGLLGEIYVRHHQFSNADLIRRMERLGAHVWLAPFGEWLYYMNILQREDAGKAGKWGEVLQVRMIDRVMKSDDQRLSAVWEGFIPNLHQPSIESLLQLGARYIDPAFRGEAVLGLGTACDFHQRGLAGIINVMPFTCMPGTITAGIFKRFQQDHDGMPVLNLSYDGQGEGNLPIRLEAFAQQCANYHRRRAGVTAEVR